MSDHVIALFSLTGTPVFGHWSVLIFYLALAGWMFCLRLMSADLQDLEQLLGAAVLDALERAHLPVKVACDLMRWDESNFRKAARGEPAHHISLTRLLRLPMTWWMVFLPSLSYLVVKTHVTQIVEDAKTLRTRV